MPRNKRRRSRRRVPREVQSLSGDSCENVPSDGTQPSEEEESVSAESEIFQHEEERTEGATDSDDKEIISDKLIPERETTSLIQGQTDVAHQSQSDHQIAQSYRVESPGIAYPGALIEKSQSLGNTTVQISELSSSGGSLVNSLDNAGNVSEPESSELDEDIPQDTGKIEAIIPKFDENSVEHMSSEQDEKIRELIACFIESAPSREKSPPSYPQKKLEKTRKKAAIESHFAPQFQNPYFLDSIREESSDTDGGNDRISVEHNAKINTFDEEDDDVFIDNTKISKKVNAVFPKGITLNLSERRRHISALHKPVPGIIREEPQCVLVDTKIVEPESIPGSSLTWETTKTDVEQGAEVVYVESGSSSASELDYSADNDGEDSITEDADVRIETPIFDSDVSAIASLKVHSEPVVDIITESKVELKSDVDTATVLDAKIEPQIEQIFQNSAFQSELVSDHPPSPDPLPNPDDCDIPDFHRQDSSGSVSSQTHSTSSHSQCTARYIASSMTDLEMDFESSAIAGVPETFCDLTTMSPLSLRQQCLDKLSTMPYGNVILRELADMSQELLIKTHGVSKPDTPSPPPPVPALPPRELLINVLDPFQEGNFYSSDPQISRHTTPPPVPARPDTVNPSSAHEMLHGSRNGIACAKDDNRLLAIIRESEFEHQQSASAAVESSATNQVRDVTMVKDPREFDNMFESISKRFSNYELGHGAANHSSTTKRYSNIETSSYESHRRVEDGRVVADEMKKCREKVTNDNGDVIKSVESESSAMPKGKVDVNSEMDKNSKGAFLNQDSGTTKIFGDDFLRVTRREKVDDSFDSVPRRRADRWAWVSHNNLSVVDESPENVTRPLAREDNLCRGQRSATEIKAPRLRELHAKEVDHHFDTLQNKVAQRRSVIDTTPITRHVDNGAQRRLSLPRDFHEKQLQYIRQKEEELQAEFEKLELDRKRLEDEITTMRISTVRDDSHSKRSSLLSDEEMFRQQMHSEWLDKVAEREERRLQKVMKITKSTNDIPVATKGTVDIENEFLRKVKERRSKLEMPADSDWESGAESQPQPRDTQPKVHNIEVKIVDGDKEAPVNKLPKHLLEFAESFTTTSHGESTERSSSFPGPRFYVICAAVAIVGLTIFRPFITNRM